MMHKLELTIVNVQSSSVSGSAVHYALELGRDGKVKPGTQVYPRRRQFMRLNIRTKPLKVLHKIAGKRVLDVKRGIKQHD